MSPRLTCKTFLFLVLDTFAYQHVIRLGLLNLLLKPCAQHNHYHSPDLTGVQ